MNENTPNIDNNTPEPVVDAFVDAFNEPLQTPEPNVKEQQPTPDPTTQSTSEVKPVAEPTAPQPTLKQPDAPTAEPKTTEEQPKPVIPVKKEKANQAFAAKRHENQKLKAEVDRLRLETEQYKREAEQIKAAQERIDKEYASKAKAAGLPNVQTAADYAFELNIQQATQGMNPGQVALYRQQAEFNRTMQNQVQQQPITQQQPTMQPQQEVNNTPATGS